MFRLEILCSFFRPSDSILDAADCALLLVFDANEAGQIEIGATNYDENQFIRNS